MIRNSEGWTRTRMGPFSMVKPPSTAPITTTIPIIANMCQVPFRGALLQCPAFDSMQTARALMLYRHRSPRFPDTKGLGGSKKRRMQTFPVTRAGPETSGRKIRRIAESQYEGVDQSPRQPLAY